MNAMTNRMDYHNELESNIARINSIWQQGLDDLEKEEVRLRKLFNRSGRDMESGSDYLLEKLHEVEKRHRHMVMRLKTNLNWLRTYSIDFENDDPCLN